MDDVDFYLEDLKSKFSKIKFDEYCLNYSGGRDSHFLLWFIKNILKDNKIKIVSVNTLMEHPEILKRMRDNADVILMPIKKHKDIKIEKGIPCFTKYQDEMIKRYQNGLRSKYHMENVINAKGKTRFRLNNKARELLLANKLHKISGDCCKYLKKEPLIKYQKQNNKKPIIGIRSSEGVMRNKINSCFHKNGSFTPIYDLTDDLLKRIEERHKIEVPKVYNHITRTGCMGCPYGRHIEEELSLISDAQRRFVSDYFKESYKVKGVNKDGKN